MKPIVCIVLLSIVGLTACTTIPERFKVDPGLSTSGGYSVESETASGFTLEVFYKSYSFFPNPDPSIQEAKAFFIEVALDIARRNGRKIKQPVSARLNASASRNVLDGYYAVYVTGEAEYSD